MHKIVVDNFAELAVIVLRQGNVRVVHGSLNCSHPGIWRTREPIEIVIVDLGVHPEMCWWRDIENKAGESIHKYRQETAFSAYWQAKEPEEKAEIAEAFAEMAT